MVGLLRWPGLCPGACGLDVGDEVAEDVANGGPKQGKDDDHDHGDKNKDERILHKALATYLRCEEHRWFLLSSSLAGQTPGGWMRVHWGACLPYQRTTSAGAGTPD